MSIVEGPKGAQHDKALPSPHNRDVSLTLSSPSKINLHLRVGPVDTSGYHPLRSWMITTTLCDEIRFEASDRRRLVCNDPTVPADATNLVWRAADALLRDPTSTAEVFIHLTKRIPAGAGLGGGSGNAATTLVGIDRLLQLGRPRENLMSIAATLGSDVPFFLGPASAIATGRGERLEPSLPPAIAKYAVLLSPPFPISTAAVYREFDALTHSIDRDPLAPFDAEGWPKLPAKELLEHLVNDLEAPAFRVEPRLAALREVAERQAKRTVRMSGSGSTLFTLFDNPDEAHAAARATADSLAIRSVFVELGKPSGFFD